MMSKLSYMGRDVAVGDTAGDPDRTLLARALADELHVPDLGGVADRERLACA